MIFQENILEKHWTNIENLYWLYDEKIYWSNIRSHDNFLLKIE